MSEWYLVSVWSQIPPTHPPVLAHFADGLQEILVSTFKEKVCRQAADVHMADVMDEMEQLNVTYTVEEHAGGKRADGNQ